MRCPKCGYISFDHVETCLKCNKDISKEGSKVEGTTYNVAPPAFLKFTKRTEDSLEEDNEILFDDTDDDIGIVDPDLDVLTEDYDEDDSEGTISFGGDMEGFGAFEEEDSFEVAPTDDDSEDEGLDLGQFEDAFDEETPAEEVDEVALDLPDELSDISDLSGPAEQVAEEQEFMEETKGAPAIAQDPDEFGDLNLDLDLKDLNDDFNLTGDEDTEEQDSSPDDMDDLSLDDLGLAEEEKKQAAPQQAESEKARKDERLDMDADLDFDLDLGGISLDDED